MHPKLNMKKDGDRPEQLARCYRVIAVQPKKKLYGKKKEL